VLTTLDEARLERLVARHKDAVYRQMVRVCGNRTDAEDALADALVTAVRTSAHIRDLEAFRSWLSLIASRACARSRIRDRFNTSLSLSEMLSIGFEPRAEGDDPHTAVERGDLKACVAAAIGQLPPGCREVYVRREIDGERAEKVAAELGITIPALKSRLHRARHIVRTSIDSDVACQS
jgi:RNA polymerase sigma-70 factor (ECF subfamily)